MRLFQKLKKKTDYKFEKVMIYAKITELKDRYMIYNSVKNERKWRNKEMDCDNQELEATKKMREEKCEYCKKDMEGKAIENRYAIETMVDDVFLYAWCECGRHTVAEIKYCPMCR